MNLALRKRPVSTEQIDSAIERIEEKLLNLGLREIPSNRIGELVMRELDKKLDSRAPPVSSKVAYVHGLPASSYRSSLVSKTLTSSRRWWMRCGGSSFTLSYAVQMPKLAGYRATAAMIAASHVERMRANVDGFTLNQYKETLTYQHSPPTGTLCNYPSCNATSLAFRDRVETQNTLRSELRPLAGMRVTCEANNCDLRRGDIWIIWDEPSVFVGLDSATSDECPDPNVAPTFPAFATPRPRCLHVRFAL
jgi:type IV pilus assembly protein PilV